jgi:aspartate aminotransferase
MIEEKLQIADRVMRLAGSPTISVMDKARKLKSAGHSVVDLSGGDPDFDTAPHVTEAAIKSLQGGFSHYTPSRGIPELLDAIARKTELENGAKYDPKKEILVTPGAKTALYTAAQAIINSGDEAILFDPCWVSYAPCVELAGGKPVYVTMDSDTTVAMLTEKLERAVNNRTRWVILNTPNNPSGMVWRREQLEVVADFVKSHNLYVLSDEIYEKLIFEDLPHVSIASLPGMTSHTLVLNGLSKSHAMTGWRMGWLAGPEMIVSQMLKIHQHLFTCATSFVQVAAVQALDGPQEYTHYMVERYKTRRNDLSAGLNAVPGIQCELVEGAFYAFPNISGTGLTDMEFTDKLLETEMVAVTPGIAFGPGGEGRVRLSFANSDEMLAEAVKRIGRFVASLS